MFDDSQSIAIKFDCQMIRSSKYKASLLASLASLIRDSQDATDALDEAAAERLGLNRTDLRCLGAALQEEKVSASKLAELIGLTRGSITTALDRLEASGYVERGENPADRRGVQVEPTAAAKRAVAAIWDPLGAEGMELLGRYSIAELEFLKQFFLRYCSLQRTHTARIRLLKSPVR